VGAKAHEVLNKEQRR